jgi:hypothetical protein
MNIEIMEAELDITSDSNWTNNLSSNQKIGIRRIAVEIDPEVGSPFRFEVDYYIQDGI